MKRDFILQAGQRRIEQAPYFHSQPEETHLTDGATNHRPGVLPPSFAPCIRFLSGLHFLVFFLLIGETRSEQAPPSPAKPNIILFLVDDMGWMDSSVYGSRYYETPNMERLARQSIRFTNAYAANPLCSPTRASLMTGKYPARLRFTTPGGHRPALKSEPDVRDNRPHFRAQLVGSRRHLPLDETTIAEAARDLGYQTCFVGKWHMGRDPAHWPDAQGFDLNIGGTGAPGPPGGYFDPYKNPKLPNRREGEYVTDRLTDETLDYLDQHADSPFFLCLWHFAVHGPWGHKEEITRRFRDKTDPRGKQGNPVMASMLASMDESLGRVMDKLDQLKIADNTILLFVSDNGGNVHSNVEGKTPTHNAPLRKGKASIFEGGTRVPMMIQWPGVTRADTTSPALVSSIDFYPTLLEMMGGTPRPGQVIDGVSLVPLLQDGSPLERDTLFCHFPHYTPAVDNIPATSVRQGDWKLIRFYCAEDDFSDRLELYNLKDDIGETRNRASEFPERVQALNAMIDQHLAHVDALVPGRNARFDPAARPPKSKKKSKRAAAPVKRDYRIMLTGSGIVGSPNPLFAEPCQWPELLKKVDGYKYYGRQFMFPEERRLDAEAFARFTKESSLTVGVEFGHMFLPREGSRQQPWERWLKEAVAEIQPVFDAGGRVDTVHIDGPIRRLLGFGGGGGRRQRSLPYDRAMEEFVTFWLALEKKYPDIRIGYLVNLPNWDYSDEHPGYVGHFSDRTGKNFREVLSEFHTKLTGAGGTLSFVEIDSPYKYYIATKTRRGDAAVDNPAKFRHLEQWCRQHKIQLHIIVNEAALSRKVENPPAELVVQETRRFTENSARYVEALSRDGISPDVFLIQSWYRVPAVHVPENKVGTTTHAALHIASRIEQRFGSKPTDAVDPD